MPGRGGIREARVQTLVRSANSQGGRTNREAAIADNTDFSRIAHDGQAFFASDNLPALAEKGEYRNSTPNWQNHYRSTIVVPIRASLSVYEDKDTCSDDEFVLLGFLCADSRREGSFGRGTDPEKSYIVALQGFADAMFPFLNAVEREWESLATAPHGGPQANPTTPEPAQPAKEDPDA
jgi:hypothetical protein